LFAVRFGVFFISYRGQPVQVRTYLTLPTPTFSSSINAAVGAGRHRQLKR